MANQTNTVELAFEGEAGSEAARRFFSYLVDGGLEDQLIQMLGGRGLELEISGCDSESLRVQFRCRKTAAKSPTNAAGKTVIKTVGKTVAKAAEHHSAKVSGKRTGGLAKKGASRR